MKSILAVLLCLFTAPVIANDYDLLNYNQYDVVASVRITTVSPATPTPAPTQLTAEVTDKFFPAPASDAQMVKLRSIGAVGTTVTRTRTVTRSTASVNSYGLGSALPVLRVAPVRRVFGLLRRGPLRARLGACSY